MSDPEVPLGLRFESVSKWYGQVSALTDLSFEIRGGVTGLVGKNGAGKSTIIKLSCGLLAPSQGVVVVGDEMPSKSIAVRRRIGLCPDLDRCYEQLSGRCFVAWMLRVSGHSARAADARAKEVLLELGLGAAMDRRIGGYSKGMRQRVKLAQAIAHEPGLLVLDEPMTGLDPVARHELGKTIHDLGARGVGVLVSSHVLHELEAIVDRVLVVHQGRLIASGTVAELRSEMADRPLQVLVRSPRPRELAARLVNSGTVQGIEIQAQGLRLCTAGGAAFHTELTAIGAEQDGLVSELLPLDDSLEAVFDYLVSR